VELKEKGKLLADLQEKYLSLSTNYQEEKRKSYEIDNTIKKYEMENRFYKEAADMQKGESNSAIDEYKRLILDKNDKIASLQAELQKKGEKIADIDN
jgi:hypothetical protein